MQLSLDGVLETKVLSSLEKVFADEELNAAEFNKGSMLLNEVYSFQVAYKWNGFMMRRIKIKVNVVSEISSWITLRQIGLIPSEMPCYPDHDDNVLRTTPGLYPDALMPMNSDGLPLLPYQWRSIWITVNPNGQVEPGNYPIAIEFESLSGDKLGKVEFQLEVINAKLPKQSLIQTRWFHTDCLATWYDVETFSEEHWAIIEKYVQTAVKHGINMILTPLFTPPLDTEVGGERPTVQLVDVESHSDTYIFDFSKLKRWVDMCRNNNIEYFEFSHLFTQWELNMHQKSWQ